MIVDVPENLAHSNLQAGIYALFHWRVGQHMPSRTRVAGILKLEVLLMRIRSSFFAPCCSAWRILLPGMLLFAILAAVLLAPPALANSGPTRWQSYPNAEILAIQENCPITVQHETLLFDLTEGSASSYTLNGQVTATYRMHNPTEDAQTVQMAFPFIHTPRAFNPELVKITSQGNPLDFTLHIGELYSLDSGGTPPDYSFAGILRGIRQESYTPQFFSQGEQAKLHTFIFENTGEEEVSVTLYYPGGSYYLGRGFHGYGSYEDGAAEFTAHTGYEVSVLVLGKNPAYTMEGFIEGDRSRPTDAFRAAVRQETVPVSDYFHTLVTQLAQETLPPQIAQNEQMLCECMQLGLRQLDQSFQFSNSATEYDITSAFEASYLQALIYTVEFLPGETREVSVSYPVNGSMDRSKTREPLHTFTYFLSPASHWASFRELSIIVLTPEEAPYLLNSSLSFSADGERCYTAQLAGLPSEALAFSLYESANIPLQDRATGALYQTFGYFAPVVLGFFNLAALIVLVTILTRRGRRKRQGGNAV